MTVKPIPGQPSSAEVRAELAAAGRPVLVAFSRGKDALATWLALRDAGVQELIPYHLHTTHGLDFVRDDLARWEQLLGVPIMDLPHPSLLERINAFTLQPPARVPHLVAAQMPQMTYEQIVDIVRDLHGLPADTWVADGVRAADSPQRRVAFADHGVWRPRLRKVSPIWDWTKAEVLERIEAEGWDLPPDYDWFGRSLDGIDYRFAAPLKEHDPQAWGQLQRWHPLIEAELLRNDLLREAMAQARRDVGDGYRERKRAEALRYRMATDGEFYLVLDFPDQAARDKFAAGLPVERGRFVAGPAVAEAFGVGDAPKPLFGSGPKRVAGKTARQRAAEAAWLRKLPRVPDPLAGVTYTDPTDLTVDAARELDALLGAFPGDADDWLCVYFASRSHKLDFLEAAGLGGFGERYLPGEQAGRILTSR